MSAVSTVAALGRPQATAGKAGSAGAAQGQAAEVPDIFAMLLGLAADAASPAPVSMLGSEGEALADVETGTDTGTAGDTGAETAAQTPTLHGWLWQGAPTMSGPRIGGATSASAGETRGDTPRGTVSEAAGKAISPQAKAADSRGLEITGSEKMGAEKSGSEAWAPAPMPEAGVAAGVPSAAGASVKLAAGQAPAQHSPAQHSTGELRAQGSRLLGGAQADASAPQAQVVVQTTLARSREAQADHLLLQRHLSGRVAEVGASALEAVPAAQAMQALARKADSSLPGAPAADTAVWTGAGWDAAGVSSGSGAVVPLADTAAAGVQTLETAPQAEPEMVSRHLHSAEIQLPGAEGPMSIQVQVSGQEATVHYQGGSEQLRTLLQGQTDQLARQLEQQGLSLVAVTVGHEPTGGGFSGSAGSSSFAGGQPKPAQPESVRLESQAELPPATQARPPSGSAGRRLDLFV